MDPICWNMVRLLHWMTIEKPPIDAIDSPEMGYVWICQLIFMPMISASPISAQ